MTKKVNRKTELAHKYKTAFDEIIGDPYALNEPITGHYQVLKQRSSIYIIKPGTGGSPTPINKAKPNQLDFFIDTENSVTDGLATYQQKTDYTLDQVLQLFDNTYWLESGVIFTQKERAEVEQIVGRILVARKVSPVRRYFIAIRK